MFDETLHRRQDMDLMLRLSRMRRCISTDAVLWIKHWTEGAISSKLSTFLPAVMDICARHPDYLTDPSYRRGLERDLGRHFVRLFSARELGTLRSDLRRYRDWGGLDVPPWRLVLRYLAQRRERAVAAGR